MSASKKFGGLFQTGRLSRVAKNAASAFSLIKITKVYRSSNSLPDLSKPNQELQLGFDNSIFDEK